MVRLIAFVIGLAVALPAAAQDRAQTLADIRQRAFGPLGRDPEPQAELSTTAGRAATFRGRACPDRVDSIEAELPGLTATTEELANRIDRIVADGTNRIGDLEFRLVELEGCDVNPLGQTSTLGGGEALPSRRPLCLLRPLRRRVARPAPNSPWASGDDFERAKGALDRGEFELAATELARFTETYPGGPLTCEAHFLRGEALSALGDQRRGAGLSRQLLGRPAGRHGA